ncbi:pro-sigmaK processing inhibitor BofA family protein [Mediterraneibacter glycyrrhizinilyticus]|nr:pro-sigmaK processing inhibitor BofA family protein [Mediterraneibacter glycyrrhizinilyticus]
MAINFVIRAIVGMTLIFFINQYVLPDDSSINVGLNAVSFLTSGTLGIPGVCLLYGIMCYQIL